MIKTGNQTREKSQLLSKYSNNFPVDDCRKEKHLKYSFLLSIKIKPDYQQFMKSQGGSDQVLAHQIKCEDFDSPVFLHGV